MVHDVETAQWKLDADSSRPFGFFRYSGSTTARVGHMCCRGNWPRELLPAEQQELAGQAVP